VILIGCIALTALAVIYVFNVPDSVSAGPEKTRTSFLEERKEAVYENLRDLNFEYKAGKVPDVDYQAMKASLEGEAAALLAEISALEANPHNSYVVSKLGRKGSNV
jgi:hypothetical protein